MQRQFHILALGCVFCLFSTFYSTLKAQTENHFNTINQENKKEEIDRIIKAFAAINKFNGTALIHYQNKNIFERSYGWQDAEKKNSQSGQECVSDCFFNQIFHSPGHCKAK